jgi:predicted nucleotidyltransferase
MPPIHPTLNSTLHRLAHRYAAAAQEALGPQLVSIALYGSVARGQATHSSDIDLFVVLQEAPAGMLARRRLLLPARESLTPELEELWMQGIYADFIEVIRSRTEAQQFHPLYLDMSQEAILLYDRDQFLQTLLEKVRERLQRAGAERLSVGRYWYWDLKQADISGEVV